MDGGGGQRENGRHKQNQYIGFQSQWLIPAHLMKDHQALSLRFLTILREREAALQERDIALSERKVALFERDTALMQRDAALAERNNALIEREQVIAAFECRENATMSVGSSPNCPERSCPPSNEHQNQNQPSSSDAAYLAREIHFADALPIPGPEITKPPRNKRPRLSKPAVFKRTPKSAKSSGRGEDLNKNVMASSSKEEWKDQDLGLNQVMFEDSSMPVPVCSCTGSFQQCYKWGNGGWQSACCTNTMSVYPLPMIPNKRHARVSGRKMSGSAFTKLLNRLAIEGYDLSAPLDLKDHWAKHGTNRYITIK